MSWSWWSSQDNHLMFVFFVNSCHDMQEHEKERRKINFWYDDGTWGRGKIEIEMGIEMSRCMMGVLVMVATVTIMTSDDVDDLDIESQYELVLIFPLDDLRLFLVRLNIYYTWSWSKIKKDDALHFFLRDYFSWSPVGRHWRSPSWSSSSSSW